MWKNYENKASSNWARNYNPELGRFILEDPLGMSSGEFNLQRYANNDPLVMRDFSGLQTFLCNSVSGCWSVRTGGGKGGINPGDGPGPGDPTGPGDGDEFLAPGVPLDVMQEYLI